MAGFLMTEATIKIKHFRRGAHSNGNPHTHTHMLLATIADRKTAASWGGGKKTAKTHPESAFGWVLTGGPLGAR